MSKVLVKWKTNWADEMDVDGFVIMTDNEAKNLRENLSELKDSFDICVGTNEYIDYNDGKELLREIEFIPVNDQEVSMIAKLFGSSYGCYQFYQKFF